jgi:hypothetical protein
MVLAGVVVGDPGNCDDHCETIAALGDNTLMAPAHPMASAPTQPRGLSRRRWNRRPVIR